MIVSFFFSFFLSFFLSYIQDNLCASLCVCVASTHPLSLSLSLSLLRWLLIKILYFLFVFLSFYLYVFLSFCSSVSQSLHLLLYISVWLLKFLLSNGHSPANFANLSTRLKFTIFGEFKYLPKWPFSEMCRTRQTRRHLPTCFARTRQTRRIWREWPLLSFYPKFSCFHWNYFLSLCLIFSIFLFHLTFWPIVLFYT